MNIAHLPSKADMTLEDLFIHPEDSQTVIQA